MAIKTRDVSTIINKDIRDGDLDLTNAYTALDDLVLHRTIGTEMQRVVAADNIGQSIMEALKLGDADVRFAQYATQELAKSGLLETRDVDDIIRVDVLNGDHDLSTAYTALDALTNHQTQDASNFHQDVLAADNIGQSIIEALKLGETDNVHFAQYATQELAKSGLLETRDVDDIIRADFLNGDHDLSTAYTALNALTNHQTQDASNFHADVLAADNIGQSIVYALKLGDDDSIHFAQYATQALAKSGLLESTDIDDIIYRDVSNGDHDLSSAYAALDAFVHGQSQGATLDQMQQIKDSIIHSAVKAEHTLGATGAEFAHAVADAFHLHTDTSAVV